MLERGEEKKWIRGFTLIELMIVLAIIGLLISLGVPSFMKFHYRARQAEVRRNLGVIRHLEETYMAEYDAYVEISAYYPGGAGSGRQSWSSAATNFTIIGFEPKGGVYYDYKVVDVNTDQTFTIYGRGDVDVDSVYNIWTMDQSGILENTNPSEF